MLSSEEEALLGSNLVAEIEPVKTFLATALSKKASGDGFLYDQIVHQLRNRTDLELLWRLYYAMAKSVSQFIRRDTFKELINGIFQFNWLTSNAKVLVTYRYLLSAIVSSDATMLVPIFRSIVKEFQATETSLTSTEASSAAKDMADQKRQCLHKSIRGIIALAPTGVSLLYPILEDGFPHKRFHVSALTEYVSQLLHICEYIPNLQHSILSLIISKCLEMDVEIVIEESGDVRIQEQYDGEEELFEFEDALNKPARFPTSSSSHSKASVYMLENSSHSIPQQVSELAEKLDSILVLLTQFIDGQISLANNKDANEDTSQPDDRLYQTLQAIFEDKILSTHKSKFVQFIIFYLVARVPRYCEYYSRQLLRMFLDEHQPGIKRQSAVLYLASFLSRSQAVPYQIVTDVLSDIVTWCGSYVSVIESHGQKAFSENEVDELGRTQAQDMSTAATISRHETFYSAVQAACYICCFHGQAIGLQQKNSTCLRADWERIFLSELEPLRYCCLSIRIEFIRLTLYIGLLKEEAWDQIPIDLIQNKDMPMSAYRSNPLDSFFPYDPCLLQALHTRVEPFFRHWTGVPGVSSRLIEDIISEDGTYQQREHSDTVGTDTDTDMLASDHASRAGSSIMGSYNETAYLGKGIAMAGSYLGSDGMAMSYEEYVLSTSPLRKPLALHESLYGRDEMMREKTDDEAPLGPDGWPMPIRRARHYSVGSTGSW